MQEVGEKKISSSQLSIYVFTKSVNADWIILVDRRNLAVNSN